MSPCRGPRHEKERTEFPCGESVAEIFRPNEAGFAIPVDDGRAFAGKNKKSTAFSKRGAIQAREHGLEGLSFNPGAAPPMPCQG